jgi:hypothetical protein
VEVCALSPEVLVQDRSTSIFSITEELSLAPPSCTHTSISFPREWLSRCRERYGLTMFRSKAKVGEVHPFPPRAISFTTGEQITPVPALFPFGQACQHLWLVERDDVYQDLACAGPTTRS